MEMDDCRAVRSSYCEFVNPSLGELLAQIKLDQVFVKGKGSYLIDSSGNTYLDFVSNYGACLLGHNYPKFKKAIERFLEEDHPVFVQPSIGYEATKLAKKLVNIAPSNLNKVIFTNSGAESIELCIKVARAATLRDGVLTTINAFHGKTICALSATGQDYYQSPYNLPLKGYRYVPFGDITALKSAMRDYGSELAVFIVEPIQGEGGVVQASPDYFSTAQKLCKQYGVKFILDEVQTGLGRAGHLLYCNRLNLNPDAIALAKGLGGGVLPIGAVLLSNQMYLDDVGLTHSSTFAGNGMACMIGSAVIDELCANDHAIIKQVQRTGSYLKGKLRQIQNEYPEVIAKIKGDGLMLGIEFSVSFDTYDGDSGGMLGLASNSGILPLLVSGYLANIHKVRVAPTLNSHNTLRVQPPLNVTSDQCDVFVNAIKECVKHISDGDTFSLIRYMLKSNYSNATQRKKHIGSKPKLQPLDKDGRYGFLVHPLTLESYKNFDSSLFDVSLTDMRELSDTFNGRLKPTIIGNNRVTAKNGETIYGEFASVPYLPEALMKMPAKKAKECIEEAVLLLKRRGAKIVGLGGYTSIVTKAGMQVSKLGVAVTTGNNYTVLSAIQAVSVAIQKYSTNIDNGIHVAIVGAGGSIGSTITREISLSARKITLIGNPINVDKTKKRIQQIMMDIGELICSDDNYYRNIKTSSIAYQIDKELRGTKNRGKAEIQRLVDSLLDGNSSNIQFEWGTSTSTLLKEADVVFVATNSTDVLIQPHYLKRNSIVCDLSRPSNVNYDISLYRPDVLIIDGGVIQTPNNDDLRLNFGFPKGLCFACMAETMMLAFDRRYENTSLGAKLKYEDQTYFKSKAEEYGFSIAGFRSFDLPLTDNDMKRLRLARKSSHEGDIDVESFSKYGNISRFLLEQFTGRKEPAIAFHATRPVTYDDAFAHIKKVAAVYLDMGCKKGDRVAILSDGCLESVMAVLACLHVGLIAVIVNPHNSTEEIIRILKFSNIQLLINNTKIEIDKDVPSMPLVTLLSDSHDKQCGVDAVTVKHSSPAMIFFTKGSTGRNMKVCHSHGNLYHTFNNIGLGVLRLTSNDRIFSTAKSYFLYGFKSILLGLGCGGGVILSPSRPTALAVKQSVSQYKPTHILSVPTIYLRLLSEDIDPSIFMNVKCFVSAGEPLPSELKSTWYEKYGKRLLDCFGTTESMGFVITNYPQDSNQESTGKPVPGFELKLVNIQSKEARPGELGVLWIKGNTTVNHYVDAETSDCYHCFVDGWYKTNDVFYKNEHGWYFYQGRANEMVKVGGEWLSPIQIERALNTYPGVKCSSVRLFNQHGVLSRPIAYVVPEGEVKNAKEYEKELISYCRTAIGKNQYPHIIRFVDELDTSSEESLRDHDDIKTIKAMNTTHYA